MSKQYIVLDQNILRDHRPSILQQWLASRPGIRYVLPDLAFLEMTKSNQWESTLSNSLQLLAQHPRRVYVCRSINEALNEELSTFQPITGHMLDHQATCFVRDLLNSIRDKGDGYALSRMRESHEHHSVALAEDHLDHAQNKQTLMNLFTSAKQSLSADFQKRLRAKSVATPERLRVIHEIAKDQFIRALDGAGLCEQGARMFMKRKPLILRYIFLRWWTIIYWIEKGGLESRLPAKVTNDELDQQYVLSATFFGDMLSNDSRARQSYADLRTLLGMKL